MHNQVEVDTQHHSQVAADTQHHSQVAADTQHHNQAVDMLNKLEEVVMHNSKVVVTHSHK
jgi:hypothetical protein